MSTVYELLVIPQDINSDGVGFLINRGVFRVGGFHKSRMRKTGLAKNRTWNCGFDSVQRAAVKARDQQKRKEKTYGAAFSSSK
jgi:hypothetical protein